VNRRRRAFIPGQGLESAGPTSDRGHSRVGTAGVKVHLSKVLDIGIDA